MRKSKEVDTDHTHSDSSSAFLSADVANAFQISHANKSFHVIALSAADKANWLANLQKHIDRVVQSGRWTAI